LYCELDESGMV